MLVGSQDKGRKAFNKSTTKLGLYSEPTIWVFPKIGAPQNEWFIIYNGNPIKMDDLGVSLFLEKKSYSS